MFRFIIIGIISLNAAWGNSQDLTKANEAKSVLTLPCAEAYYGAISFDDICSPSLFTLDWTLCSFISPPWVADSVVWNMWDGQSITTIGNASVTYSYQSGIPIINSASVYLSVLGGSTCVIPMFTSTDPSLNPCTQNQSGNQSFSYTGPTSALPHISISSGNICTGDTIQVFDIAGAYLPSSPMNFATYELLLNGTTVASGIGFPDSLNSIFQTNLSIGNHLLQLTYFCTSDGGASFTTMSSDSLTITVQDCSSSCPSAYYGTIWMSPCYPTSCWVNWDLCDSSNLWIADSVIWDMWDGQSITTIGNLPISYQYQSVSPFISSAIAYLSDQNGFQCEVPILTSTDPSADPCTQTQQISQNFQQLEVYNAEPDLFISGGNYCSGDLIQIFDLGGYSSPLMGYWGVESFELLLDNVSVASGTGFPDSLNPIFQTYLSAGNHSFELIYTIYDPNASCTMSDSLTITIQDCPPCELCTNFRPDPTKRYWLSAWVKEAHPEQVKTYSDAFVQLEFLDSTSSQTIDFYTTGEIIEGWQRIVGDFVIPAGTIDLEIHLVNEGNSAAFFDDIRINPFNSSMKSYVYDPQTLWLTTELDDNNYATFYEYDSEGNLTRIKKETARGIMTIQESTNSNPKKQ